MTFKTPSDDEIYRCGACGWRGTYDLGYCPQCSFLTYRLKRKSPSSWPFGCALIICFVLLVMLVAVLVAAGKGYRP